MVLFIYTICCGSVRRNVCKLMNTAHGWLFLYWRVLNLPIQILKGLTVLIIGDVGDITLYYFTFSVLTV